MEEVEDALELRCDLYRDSVPASQIGSVREKKMNKVTKNLGLKRRIVVVGIGE